MSPMKIELIVCTYMRPVALCTLLDSISLQRLRPDYITIVDGSTDGQTEVALGSRSYDLNIKYYRVNESDRGLTRQRNFGISRLADDTEIVAFLDDDTVLQPGYFESIASSFSGLPDAVGVGGYIQEVTWYQGSPPDHSSRYFEFDGWYRHEPARNRVRKAFGLGAPQVPCVMPEEGNGRSVGSIPPTGKTYPVEYFMGGVAAYRRRELDKVKFSTYFEGYGLYEDLDFCLRLSKHGSLYVNTSAVLLHYHEPSGRPNSYRYGRMVVRNGWYVWRVKFESPQFSAAMKWWATTWLLASLRLLAVVRGPQRVHAFTEWVGRISGMASLIYSRPKVARG